MTVPRKLLALLKRLFGSSSVGQPVPFDPVQYVPPLVPAVTGTIHFGSILGGGQGVLHCMTLTSALAGRVDYAWYATRADLEAGVSRLSDRAEHRLPVYLSPGQVWSVWLRCKMAASAEPIVMKFSYARDLDGGWPPFGTVTHV